MDAIIKKMNYISGYATEIQFSLMVGLRRKVNFVTGDVHDHCAVDHNWLVLSA